MTRCCGDVAASMSAAALRLEQMCLHSCAGGPSTGHGSVKGSREQRSTRHWRSAASDQRVDLPAAGSRVHVFDTAVRTRARMAEGGRCISCAAGNARAEGKVCTFESISRLLAETVLPVRILQSQEPSTPCCTNKLNAYRSDASRPHRSDLDLTKPVLLETCG